MIEDKELESEFRDEAVIPQKQFFLKRTFTALKYPNYRLWFWGQMTSLMGTWMQITAQGFLVYDLTHSPEYLGYVGFAAGIPSWFLMLYGGVIADRFDKRNILVITQYAMMALAAVLAVLTFLNIIQPWEIILMAFLLGVTNSFDAPSRISLVNELVPKEDLTNAIALNATLFNTASASGPAIAGITYALAGPAWCYTINAISFIGVIIALKKMKLRKTVIKTDGRSAFSELKEGIKYILTTPVIRTIIICVGVMSIFGISVVTLLPAWAVKILGGDAATNGFLQSARGIGALAAALTIATLGRIKYKGKLFTIGFSMFPLIMLAFSFISWLPASLAALFAMGGFLILTMNIANSLVQTLVPDFIRGRVMSVYSLTFFGLMPFGALMMGSFAGKFGEPETILISSIAAFTVSVLIFIFAPYIRKLE